MLDLPVYRILHHFRNVCSLGSELLIPTIIENLNYIKTCLIFLKMDWLRPKAKPWQIDVTCHNCFSLQTVRRISSFLPGHLIDGEPSRVSCDSINLSTAMTTMS